MHAGAPFPNVPGYCLLCNVGQGSYGCVYQAVRTDGGDDDDPGDSDDERGVAVPPPRVSLRNVDSREALVDYLRQEAMRQALPKYRCDDKSNRRASRNTVDGQSRRHGAEPASSDDEVGFFSTASSSELEIDERLVEEKGKGNPTVAATAASDEINTADGSRLAARRPTPLPRSGDHLHQGDAVRRPRDRRDATASPKPHLVAVKVMNMDGDATSDVSARGGGMDGLGHPPPAIGIMAVVQEVASLSLVHQPNVVRLLDCVLSGGPLVSLVLEWIDGGTLADLLLARFQLPQRGVGMPSFSATQHVQSSSSPNVAANESTLASGDDDDDDDENGDGVEASSGKQSLRQERTRHGRDGDDQRRHPLVTFEVVGAIAHDILSALHHLHRRLLMIHRDVKSGNIFFRRDGTAVLGDLGSSGIMEAAVDSEVGSQRRTVVGTPGWIAPEVLQRQQMRQDAAKTAFASVAPSEAGPNHNPLDSCSSDQVDTGYGVEADIYSFGVTLWTIATTGLPPTPDTVSELESFAKSFTAATASWRDALTTTSLVGGEVKSATTPLISSVAPHINGAMATFISAALHLDHVLLATAQECFARWGEGEGLRKNGSGGGGARPRASNVRQPLAVPDMPPWLQLATFVPFLSVASAEKANALFTGHISVDGPICSGGDATRESEEEHRGTNGSRPEVSCPYTVRHLRACARLCHALSISLLRQPSDRPTARQLLWHPLVCFGGQPIWLDETVAWFSAAAPSLSARRKESLSKLVSSSDHVGSLRRGAFAMRLRARRRLSKYVCLFADRQLVTRQFNPAAMKGKLAAAAVSDPSGPAVVVDVASAAVSPMAVTSRAIPSLASSANATPTKVVGAATAERQLFFSQKSAPPQQDELVAVHSDSSSLSPMRSRQATSTPPRAAQPTPRAAAVVAPPLRLPSADKRPSIILPQPQHVAWRLISRSHPVSQLLSIPAYLPMAAVHPPSVVRAPAWRVERTPGGGHRPPTAQGSTASTVGSFDSYYFDLLIPSLRRSAAMPEAVTGGFSCVGHPKDYLSGWRRQSRRVEDALTRCECQVAGFSSKFLAHVMSAAMRDCSAGVLMQDGQLWAPTSEEELRQNGEGSFPSLFIETSLTSAISYRDDLDEGTETSVPCPADPKKASRLSTTLASPPPTITGGGGETAHRGRRPLPPAVNMVDSHAVLSVNPEHLRHLLSGLISDVSEEQSRTAASRSPAPTIGGHLKAALEEPRVDPHRRPAGGGAGGLASSSSFERSPSPPAGGARGESKPPHLLPVTMVVAPVPATELPILGTTLAAAGRNQRRSLTGVTIREELLPVHMGARRVSPRPTAMVPGMGQPEPERSGGTDHLVAAPVQGTPPASVGGILPFGEAVTTNDFCLGHLAREQWTVLPGTACRSADSTRDEAGWWDDRAGDKHPGSWDGGIAAARHRVIHSSAGPTATRTTTSRLIADTASFMLQRQLEDLDALDRRQL